MSLNVLYFPGTSPAKSILASLLVVCDTVWCYQPTENLSLGDMASLAGRGLVKAVVPAPLDDGLAHFEGTVRDLLAHGQEYRGAYLASMAQEAGPGGAPPDWSLVSELIGEKKSGADPELWQARLLLRLQEVLDLQERDARRGIAELAVKKAAVLGDLRGEAERARALSGTVRAAALSPARAAQLVRAWARLFGNDHSADRPAVFATDQEAAASFLLTSCEKFYKKSGQPVLELILPGMAVMEADGFLGRLTDFRQQAGSTLCSIQKELLAVAVDGDDVTPGDSVARFAELLPRWRAAVEPLLGAGPRTALTFYRMPGAPLARLMARVVGRPEIPPTGDGPASGILAVLEEQS